MVNTTLTANKKWTLGGIRQPLLIIQSTAFFRQQICFRVVAINVDCLEVVSEQLLPKLSFTENYTARLEFPLVGQIKVPIQFVSQIAPDFSRFTIKIIESSVSKKFKEYLAEYLFRFVPAADLESLRTQGLKLKSIRNLVNYGFVETSEDLAEVGVLRQMTYGKTAKVNKETQFTDAFDHKSKILVVRHHQRMIASVRIYYPKAKNEQLEHQQYAIDFPESFPQNTDIAEMMRLCTHENYRKSDLLLGILEFAAIDILQQGRTYVLGCAEKKLLPLYRNLGFKDTKITYPNPTLNNIPHHVILMDIEAIGQGKMNPIQWNLIWGETAKFGQQKHLISLSGLAALRVTFYHRIKPFTKWVYTNFLKPTRK